MCTSIFLSYRFTPLVFKIVAPLPYLDPRDGGDDGCGLGGVDGGDASGGMFRFLCNSFGFKMNPIVPSFYNSCSNRGGDGNDGDGVGGVVSRDDGSCGVVLGSNSGSDSSKDSSSSSLTAFFSFKVE